MICKYMYESFFFVSRFKNDSMSHKDIDVLDDFEFVDFASFYCFVSYKKTYQKMRKDLLYINKDISEMDERIFSAQSIRT